MAFEGTQANIVVNAVEQKTIKNGSVMTKITDSEGKKYSFFNKKKDGTESAAYQGFQGVSIGDTVAIGVVEEEKEFIGDEGKPIKYTQRTIRFAEKVNPDGNYEVKPPTYTHKPDPIQADSNDLPF